MIEKKSTMHCPNASKDGHRLPAAMVSRKLREDKGEDGSLGNAWESVSGNNKENW
jgi:hypothetical protein